MMAFLITNVLITGGKQGLGLELCKVFSKNGCNVFTTGRNYEEVTTSLSSNGIQARVLQLDFVHDTFDEIAQSLEPLPPMSTIIHNVSPYDDSQIMSLTNEQANKYTSFIKNNMAFLQASGRKLTENGSGRFFAIGSVAGQPNYMNPVRTMYSFYKATLRPMLEIFNLETPQSVSGTYINLGTMREEAEKDDVIKTSEVAEMIFQLASQDPCPNSIVDIIGKNDPYYSMVTKEKEV